MTGRRVQLRRVVQFDNIVNNPWQLLAKYFPSDLQIDYQYAFSSNERWLIRFPVQQDALTASNGRMIRKLPLTNRSGLGVLDNPLYILTTLSSKREDIWFLFLIRYGDKTPKTLCGRAFGIMWILIGVITLSLFTATFTNAMQASLDGTGCREIGGKEVSNPNMNT